VSGSSLQYHDVRLAFATRRGEVDVINRLDLDLSPGEIVAVRGPSGSGKSSVLSLACGIIRPTSGSVRLDDVEVSRLSTDEACKLRSRTIGFVFQAFHLLAHLSAEDNVMVGARIANVAPGEARSRAIEALQTVGLAQRADHKPAELSGGEQQRVALARAMVTRPGLILADEPTGNLDPAAATLVGEILVAMRADLGSTILLATHSPEVAVLADREITLGSAATR
jgi:putative ABC transport system ATP-binding protein